MKNARTFFAALAAAVALPLAADASAHSLDFSATDAASRVPPAALAVGDSVSLSLPGGACYELAVDAETPSFGGARSFSARDAAGYAFATLVFDADGGVQVEVRDIAADTLRRAALRGGRLFSEEIDLASVRRGGCVEVDADDEADGPAGGIAQDAEPSRGKAGAVPGNPFDDNLVAPAPVMVDIMIVFDSGARAWTEAKAAYGGSITNFAMAQVAKMNNVLRNTDLHTNFWFRLVDVATVDGRWTKIDDTILPAMRKGVMEASGIWSEVAARREACGADVVSLMVDTGSAYGTTGIGYITHGTSYSTWVNTYRTWCYSCCAIRSVDLEYTLCHEVGHNLGLTHSPTLATWNKVGTFDYSNGYNITNANDGRHYNTIMAYNYDRYFSDYREIPYFSSPLHCYAGVPVGTAISNDCTRALRQTCLGIAD